MRKILIAVLVIVIAIVLVWQYFTFTAGAGKNGEYRILMVNKNSGAITQLWGK